MRPELIYKIAHVEFTAMRWDRPTKHPASVSAYALKGVLWMIWAFEDQPFGYEEMAIKAGMSKTACTYALATLLRMGVIEKRREKGDWASRYKINVSKLNRYVGDLALCKRVMRYRDGIVVHTDKEKARAESEQLRIARNARRRERKRAAKTRDRAREAGGSDHDDQPADGAGLCVA